MYFKNGIRKFHSLAHRFLNEVVTNEPDFFDQFKVKAESWILDRNDLSQIDLETIIGFYYKAMELMLEKLENYNSDIFENNQNYLDVVYFHTGGGEHSFSDIYDKVRGSGPFFQPC